MAKISLKVTSAMTLTFPPGESLQSSDPSVVSIAQIGPDLVVKALKVGTCTVAFMARGVNVDSFQVSVIS
jgi:hypothetical protein